MVALAAFLFVPPQNPEDAAWFVAHVQPHEALLRAWLRSSFPSENDVDDVVQEALARVVQAHAQTRIEAPIAFLFATARNLALMPMRHEKVAPRANGLAESALESILDEHADV